MYFENLHFQNNPGAHCLCFIDFGVLYTATVVGYVKLATEPFQDQTENARNVACSPRVQINSWILLGTRTRFFLVNQIINWIGNIRKEYTDAKTCSYSTAPCKACPPPFTSLPLDISWKLYYTPLASNNSWKPVQYITDTSLQQL